MLTEHHIYDIRVRIAQSESDLVLAYYVMLAYLCTYVENVCNQSQLGFYCVSTYDLLICFSLATLIRSFMIPIILRFGRAHRSAASLSLCCKQCE